MTFTVFVSVPMVPAILVRAAGNRIGRVSAPCIRLDTGNLRVQNGRPVPVPAEAVPVRGSGLNPYGLTRGSEKTRGSSNPSGIPTEQDATKPRENEKSQENCSSVHRPMLTMLNFMNDLPKLAVE
ncbi:hypothetical protein B0H10DRAFT_1959242 [Mycena sp. CBHHK59/15]|nr:hypothetical protein B0H10DRAFT_1959242 [Mycena sp. CBHHK59/15]